MATLVERVSKVMRFKDWAPREHQGMRPEEHMARMFSFGDVNSKWVYFNPVITIVSALAIWGFVIWAAVAQTEAAEKTQEAQAWVTDVWNWLYMVSQNVWIVVLFYLLFKFYNLKLGKEEDEPEFSDASYFAMLFSCGVATGLWFYSAEGMWHYEGYGNPRWTDKMMFNDNTRAEHALMVTFFHWGLHGWIPYVVVGAIVAIMSHRRGFPMSMRFTLYPLIGEMCYGVLGDLIEVLSILCTIFGVCTSLGLGAMQINAGLVRLDRGTYRGKDSLGCDKMIDAYSCSGRTGITVGTESQVVIIIGVTFFATLSVVLGLKAGIQKLSMIAFVLSLFILLSVTFLDEPWYIANALSSTVGYYLWYLPKISFHTDAWEELGTAAEGVGGAPDGRGGTKGWMNGWTIFYWGWWISWAPFVGTFLARISKGRKLGSFIIATLILPTIFSFLFLGIFGAAQIRISRVAEAAGLNMADKPHVYGLLANKSEVGYKVPSEDGSSWHWQPVSDNAVRLYALATEDVVFEHLNVYGGETWATFTTVITLICIVLYFVTSSDSASFVVDIMAANGREEPPLAQKIFWAFTEGACAIALLVSAGDENPKAALTAVQALPIILGLPFTFLLFWMCQGLVIICKEEAGMLVRNRKHFGTFLLNIEPASFVSFVAPFIPMGKIASNVWGANKIVATACFALFELCVIVLLCLGAVDKAFMQMAGALYFMFALSGAWLRMATRIKLGISGDMLSDMCAACFALPFALGQMTAEDFSAVPVPQKE